MDIKLDATTGDIAFSNGDALVTDIGAEDLAQRIQIRLKTFQGEWFMDNTLGVDWFGRIFGKNRSKMAVDAILQTEIAKEKDVLQIVSYTSTIDSSKRFNCSFRVRTQNGAVSTPINFNIASPV